MKVIDIKRNQQSERTWTFDGLTLYPLIVKTRNFWGVKTYRQAIPTDRGPKYLSNSVQHPIWVDEMGEEYSLPISKQLTDFCRTFLL